MKFEKWAICLPVILKILMKDGSASWLSKIEKPFCGLLIDIKSNELVAFDPLSKLAGLYNCDQPFKKYDLPSE